MGESAMDGGLGTEAPIPPANWSLRETSVASMATRSTFLAVFIILGVVGNTVLVATIAQSNRLKGTVLNLFIISISIANLVNCLGNMPLILGSTIKQEWDYGQVPCQINAFGLHLVSLTMILGLVLMTVDRFLGVKNPNKQDKKLTVVKANILIVYSWVQSIALSFPLLINVVPVVVFYNSYLCSVNPYAPLVYIVFLTVFGYLLPVILIVAFNIFIVKVGIQEKLKDSKMGSQQNYTDSALDEPRIWTEINASKYVGVLVILWCIFEGPYLLLSSIQQYKTSIEELYSDSTVNFAVPWQVELAFTWMKLSYPIYLPIVTFGWKKEVWQKFKNCMLCRKSNLVLDASPKSTPEHRKANGEAGKKDTSAASEGVPVIFATEDGLHIQTYEKKQLEDYESDSDDEEYEPKSDPSHVLTARKCDVYGSQDFLQKDEDTSDYDSNVEIDPFSSSNPISVRTEYEKNTKTSLHFDKTPQSRNNSTSQEVKDIEEHGKKVSKNETIISDNQDKQTSPGNKKKKKKKKVIADPEENENEVDVSGDYERTSHDSGRGSMEDRSKKRKEKKALREQSERQEQNNINMEHDEQDCECETNVDDFIEPQEEVQEKKPSHTTEKVTFETEAIVHDPSINEQSKVKKKKKKKKSHKDSSIEMMENHIDVIPVKNVGAKGRPLPELNPVELERSMISAKPLNPPPKLPAVSGSKAQSTQRTVPRDSTSHQPVDEPAADKIHQRSFSESHLNDQDTPQRPIPAKRSKSRTTLAETEPKPKPRAHKRGNTSDSQTHLLSSSNTSTDLSEINNYNDDFEKTVNEKNISPPIKPRRKNKPAGSTDRLEKDMMGSELSAI